MSTTTRTGRLGRSLGTLAVALLATLTASVGLAGADGTETLGAPSIPIAEGSGIVAAGTGLLVQPGTIDINVPGAVVQTLLYWEGHASAGNGDDTIVVDGNEITGALIGGPTLFFSDSYSSTYRADITDLGVVTVGANSLTVSGLEFDRANNGAGVLVIYDDGTTSSIDLVDGNDLAFLRFASPLDTTVPQTFSFAADSVDRVANVSMFFSSVAGDASGLGLRPSVIRIETGGIITDIVDVLDSIDEDEWDTVNIDIVVPAEATSITMQALSEDSTGSGNLPASFAWNAAAVSVHTGTTPVLGRMTGGGSNWTVDGYRITRGFEIHCDLRDPNNIQFNWQGNRFHMTSLDTAICTDEPGYNENPPEAGFDTFVGTGTGLYNGDAGATLAFRFEDHGEPGSEDRATFTIKDADGNTVAEVIDNALRRGNFQAHRDTP